MASVIDDQIAPAMSPSPVPSFQPPPPSSTPNLLLSQVGDIIADIIRHESGSSSPVAVLDLEANSEVISSTTTSSIDPANPATTRTRTSFSTHTSDHAPPNTNPITRTRHHGSDNDERITRRLKTFFCLITGVIIPTAIALGGILIWMMFSARRDRHLSCDQPLFFYAYLSLGVFIYSPHHNTMQKILFGYDPVHGSTRPRKVLIFERCYQAFLVTYSALGFIWVSNSSTCSETAPNLFHSVQAYVAVLFLLLFSILLPLLCLPCIFVWLMRQGFMNSQYSTNVGVPPGVVDKMKVIAFDEQFDDVTYPKECCICMMEFESGNGNEEKDKIVQTQCSHVFHKDCVQSWLGKNQLCPLCRKNLSTEQVQEQPPEIITTTTSTATTTIVTAPTAVEVII
ncbi:hypothetical protein ScalyP_jg5139 [Parmales sp. scaly parma]|nr:hypothetical protein ScalyP_jg5139 [Parmales sp. scaly parma]